VVLLSFFCLELLKMLQPFLIEFGSNRALGLGGGPDIAIIEVMIFG
jgi:hypothetical protein